MGFEFTCPKCGAASRADEQMIGESGPCHQCGNVVTVFPSSSQVEPPQVWMAALFGALLVGVIFFALMMSLRTIPLFQILRGAMMLTWNNVIPELGGTALAGFLGLVVGGLYFGLAALVVDTRRSYLVVRRGIFIGAIAGMGLGAIIGISLAMQPAQRVNPFHMRGNIIGTATACGLAALAGIGGVIAVPFALHSEKRLVTQAKFSAPAPPPSKTTTAEAPPVAAPDETPAEPRAELTQDRRQALIRRLGLVHEEDSPEADGNED